MKIYVKPDADLQELQIDENIMSGLIDSTEVDVEDDW